MRFMGRGMTNSPAVPELSLDEWFALPADAPGELVDGHLVEEEVLGASSGTLADVPGCDGLTLDLDGIWAAIDDLE